MKPIAVTALVLSIIAVCIALEYSLWTECRETNSWLYCVRVITR